MFIGRFERGAKLGRNLVRFLFIWTPGGLLNWFFSERFFLDVRRGRRFSSQMQQASFQPRPQTKAGCGKENPKHKENQRAPNRADGN